jgi:hypothetical protein
MTDAGDNMSMIIDEEEEEDAVPVSHSYLLQLYLIIFQYKSQSLKRVLDTSSSSDDEAVVSTTKPAMKERTHSLIIFTYLPFYRSLSPCLLYRRRRRQGRRRL